MPTSAARSNTRPDAARLSVSECTLAVLAWLPMLAIPAALVVFMWPAMTGVFAPLAFGLTLAIGFTLAAFVVWLFAPLVVFIAAVAAGLHGACQWVSGKLRKP